jgi:hypothetical protein
VPTDELTVIELSARFWTHAASLLPDGAASMNVLVDNQGNFSPAGNSTVAAVTVKDFQQTSTGHYKVQLGGPGLALSLIACLTTRSRPSVGSISTLRRSIRMAFMTNRSASMASRI